MNDLILTDKEAMAMFKIKDPHVWRSFLSQNKIPFFFVGNKRRFYLNALISRIKTIGETNAKKLYENNN